jgi:hypothetical protein
MPGPTRRELIRWIGGAAAALQFLPACGDNAGDSLFSADELRMLRGFADAVIPDDDQPGGAKLGAVPYIERLLRALDHAVPKIYAGGPFSIRHSQHDDFSDFIELDRVSLAAWQNAIPEIDRQLRAGLRAAVDTTTKSVDELTAEDFERLFDASDDAFKDLMIDLVSEAAFAAPEYGGNPPLAGWKMIQFEGDIQPIGYSQWDGTKHVERPEAPLSTANPRDPEPMSDDTREILALAINLLGGRVS